MREIKKLNAKEKIFSLLLLNDGRLACSTSNSEILLFDLVNYTDSKISTLHSKPITYISQLDNSNIISCSLDRTINIFTYPSYTKIDVISTKKRRNSRFRQSFIHSPLLELKNISVNNLI